jgi:hypothetical protein
MRNVSEKNLLKNTFYVSTLFDENRAVYEIKWKNIVQPDKRYRRQYKMAVAFYTTDT